MTSFVLKFDELRNLVRYGLLLALALFGPLFAWPVAAPAMESKLMEVTTEDGVALRVILARGEANNHAGVVLFHMYQQGKESWEPLLKELTGRGFTCLAMDLRGHGGSRFSSTGEDLSLQVVARDHRLFRDMYKDGETGVRYLISQGVDPERIGLVGASVGSSIAIDVTTRRKVPVRAVVVMTPGREYLGIPTMKQIEKWPDLPLLILSSAEEADLGAREIYKTLQTRGAELEIFNQQEIHGTYMFGKVPGVEKLISDWLASKLLSK